MQDTLDIVDSFYDLLNRPEVTTLLPIYGHERPTSELFDEPGYLVIKSLALTGEQGIQDGVVNINIHVPVVKMTVSGIPASSVPNTTRFKQVMAVLKPLLTDGFINLNGNELGFTIQLITGPYKEEKLAEYFMNIRVSIYAINLY